MDTGALLAVVTLLGGMAILMIVSMRRPRRRRPRTSGIPASRTQYNLNALDTSRE